MNDETVPALLAGDSTQQPQNPYVAPQLPQPSAASFAAPPGYRPPPRVWTVFVTILVALGVIFATQIVAIIGIVGWYMATGGNPGDLEDDLFKIIMRPDMFIGLGLLTQVSIAITAIAAARASPVPFRERLGFLLPAAPLWEIVLLLLGSIVPFTVGMFAAVQLAEVIPPDESVAALYEGMTLGWAIPFLLFISLAPGFSEEILFRGYAQRRLIERWGPFVAILLASAIFAVFHITPHAVTFAFPVGIWLGVMAWRTNSVWPGILCHAAINGLWNVWQLGQQFEYFPEEPPLLLLAGLGTVGGLAFLASILLLFQQVKGAPASPAPPAP